MVEEAASQVFHCTQNPGAPDYPFSSKWYMVAVYKPFFESKREPYTIHYSEWFKKHFEPKDIKDQTVVAEDLFLLVVFKPKALPMQLTHGESRVFFSFVRALN
jgi:hypothetical protein